MLRLARGPVLSKPKVLVWRQVLGCAYTLICEPQENLLQASNFLSTFVTLLGLHFNDPAVSGSPQTVSSSAFVAVVKDQRAGHRVLHARAPSLIALLTVRPPVPRRHRDQFLDHTDDIVALLHEFLPSGQLLFYTGATGGAQLHPDDVRFTCCGRPAWLPSNGASPRITLPPNHSQHKACLHRRAASMMARDSAVP